METTEFLSKVDINTISFVTNKYSQDLLVDVAWIHEMTSFRKTTDPYTLDFYDVTLITGGTGSFWLDEKQYDLKPQQLLFTSPGQVRRWYASDLEGICLFFPASFFLTAFTDPLLLHRLNYFHTKIGPGDIVLDADKSRTLLMKLTNMHQEINSLQQDSKEVLLAQTYEVLLYINRWYTQQFGQIQEKAKHRTVSRFRKALDNHFYQYHKVAQYASLIGVTPGHLNVLCKMHLDCSASELIMVRLMTEAKRQLAHSHVSIDELSIALGFANPSYFCRVFKREVGCTPIQYRKKGK
jgi:AraC-like DNA-binding protein